MNLVTPDFGLLFWMVVIFGIVFFLLAKFGFPIITGMVEQRNAKITQALKDADEIQARMQAWEADRARMMDETRREQASILREAAETKARIVADAKLQAKEEAAEKESALREVRKEVALLSVEVAEKILRGELSDKGSDRALIDRLVDEAEQNSIRS